MSEKKPANIVSATVSKTVENKALRSGCAVAAPFFQTRNYDLFKFFPENRPVIPSHVAQLEESMRERYEPRIVVVTPRDGAYFLVDGQHGFTAARNLKLPIYFQIVENLTIDDVVRLNRKNKSWGAADYLYHYCAREYSDYIRIRDFRSEHLLDEINITDAINIIKSSSRNKEGYGIRCGWTMDSYKDGTLKVTDDEIAGAVEFAAHLLEIEKCVGPHWKKRNFLSALHLIYCQKGYRKVRMAEKMRKYGKTVLSDRSSLTIVSYGNAIEDIYNKASRQGEGDIFVNWKELDSKGAINTDDAADAVEE